MRGVGPGRVMCVLLALGLLAPGCGVDRGVRLFTSPQSNPVALAPDGSRLYVANTTSGTVSVLDAHAPAVLAEVRVGVDPVGLAVRPDGLEVWVTNHVSDSVSVLDTDPTSPTFHQVKETVQAFDGGATDFDEPVGVAFASSAKAYVALSSTNRVAIVDTASYGVTGYLPVTAQDPRALAVRGGHLYVAAFESGNTSQLSIFSVGVRFGGGLQDIVRDSVVPDRDLFVFRTSDDQLVDVVEGAGTLLYGLDADALGRVWLTVTEARNDANGTTGENLIDLQNRMFQNRLVSVDCPAGACGAPVVSELDPPLPAQPSAGDALATPYGIRVSGDGSVLIATAAASSRLFTFDTASRTVLARLDVGAIPRGVALRSDAQGAPETAFVLNSLEGSVSVVDVSSPASPLLVATIPVGSDPTPPDVRAGRIAFNDAGASTSHTFSCASCHPDGHTDQLIWRIGGGSVSDPADEARNTMPVRGLREASLPLHWDGTLGDPYGGPNGEGTSGTSCALSDPHGCFRDLVDESLAGVMCAQDDGCASGGALDETARDQMARFLRNVSYPPARRRALDDRLSPAAEDGLFDMTVRGCSGGVLVGGTGLGGGCHAFPLGAGTNDTVAGNFDAPTLRGLNDRFLHFSNGGTGNVAGIQARVPGWHPDQGMDELATFLAAFPAVLQLYGADANDLFEMIEESSTGYSGAFARQVTLNARTLGPAEQAATQALLDELEAAADRGAVGLIGSGVYDDGSGFAPVKLLYDPDATVYRLTGHGAVSPAQLVADAQAGLLTATLSGALDLSVSHDRQPQPLVAAMPPPVLSDPDPFPVLGWTVASDARILIDGDPVPGAVACATGTFDPWCPTQGHQIDLDALPAPGRHVLQLQNGRNGLLSNEVPICVGSC